MHDPPDEGGQRLAQTFFADVDGCGRDDLAFGVVSRRFDAEADGGAIDLRQVHQVFGDAGGLAEEDEQDAGGGGVERAGVADAALAGGAAHVAHDVERGLAGRLVDRQDAGRHLVVGLFGGRRRLRGADLPHQLEDVRRFLDRLIEEEVERGDFADAHAAQELAAEERRGVG